MIQPVNLVVGSDGVIGAALSRRLQYLAKPVLGTTRRRDAVSQSCLYLDLAGQVDDWRCPEPVAVAFLCAGVTGLEACRNDPAASARVNVNGISTLAGNLAASGAFVIYLSTNQVFDGSTAAQRPDAPHSPVTEYGRQKAAAESRLFALGDQVCVVRLSKIISPDTPLFNRWIEALKGGQIIHPFSDMVMAPVPLSFSVDVLQRIGERQLPGVIQVSGGEDITYEEAAFHIARRLGASRHLVRPVHSSEAVPFPSHTTLDTARLREELGMEPPGIQAAIDSMLRL